MICEVRSYSFGFECYDKRMYVRWVGSIAGRSGWPKLMASHRLYGGFQLPSWRFVHQICVLNCAGIASLFPGRSLDADTVVWIHYPGCYQIRSLHVMLMSSLQ